MEDEEQQPSAVEWSPSPRTLAFLAAIRVYPSITLAARAAKVSRESHYRRLGREPAYRAAFEEAYRQGIDALEDEAVRRAMRGVQRPILYHGSPVMVMVDPNDESKGMRNLFETEYSDTLLLALLKAKKPESYKERVEQNVTGSIDITTRLQRGRERLAKRPKDEV
jgi:hypothetical protein